jgi:hypothetical protein
MTRARLIAALFGAALPLAVFARTTEDLKNDAATTSDVLTVAPATLRA